MSAIPSLTCGIYGAEGVGKSAFILRHSTGEYNTKGHAKCMDKTIPFYTSSGPINMHFAENTPEDTDYALVLFKDNNTFWQAMGMISMMRLVDPARSINPCGREGR